MAILLHKAPASFGLSAVLLREGYIRRSVRSQLILFSLAAPVGALVTFALVSLFGGDATSVEQYAGYLLLFSAGTLLFSATNRHEEANIAITDDNTIKDLSATNTVPADLGKEAPSQMYEHAATLLGMGVPLLFSLIGH